MNKTDEIASRLRAALEDVTPGPWLASAIGITSIKTNETVVDGCGVQRSVDEQYIANCDPQSILAILDKLDRMTAEIKEIALQCLEDEMPGDPEFADYRVAYATMIRHARAALEEGKP